MRLTEITPGVISQIPIIVLCINIPMLIVEFRKSSILKRLASSNIKKYNILLAFIFYGVLISIISSVFIFSLSILLFGDKTSPVQGNAQIALIEALNDVDWSGLALSYFLMLILSSGIGIFIASISKNAMSAMAIGLFILIPGGFLSGQYLSPNMILSSKYLNYVSYLIWQKYPSNLMIASFDGHNIFSGDDIMIIDYDKPWEKIVWLTKLQKILFISLPLVISPIIFGLSLKTFKWSNR